MMRLRAWQLALLLALLLLWHVLVQIEWLPRFFFGEPLAVARRILAWFRSGEIPVWKSPGSLRDIASS